VTPLPSTAHLGIAVGAFAGENVALDEVSDSFLLDVDIAGVLAQRSVLIVTPEKMLYMRPSLRSESASSSTMKATSSKDSHAARPTSCCCHPYG
jgi:hypothetical protein